MDAEESDDSELESPDRLPMRVVSRLTGLHPDTIRAWERRYGAIEPRRTAGGARRYSHADVERLSLLRDAISNGFAISDAVQFDEERLRRARPVLGSSRESVGPKWEDWIENYLSAIRSYELRAAEEMLHRAAAILPPREFALRVVAPLLREVGDRWEEGELGIAEEHLVSGQVERVLGQLTAHRAELGAPRVLIAAPTGHRHVFGALIATILVSGHGAIPLYLGADLPWPELRSSARQAGVDLIILAISRDVEEDEANSIREELRTLSKEIDTWVGAPEHHALTRGKTKGRMLTSFESLDAALTDRFQR